MNIPKLLHHILSIKRPTKDSTGNLAFIKALVPEGVVDNHNNLTLVIGDSKVAFTCHTDTVDNKNGFNKLRLVGNNLSVEGGGVLGADDGSGMYLMLKMIEAGKPGTYVFFDSEEQGRVGSSLYFMPSNIELVVSFDRKGTKDLITHQMGERGCSEKFQNYFCQHFPLPYKPDPTGSFTDSYSFFEEVKECINLSVGYYNQHTKNEYQDVEFLLALEKACIEFDWESCPCDRVPMDYIPYGRSQHSRRYSFTSSSYKETMYGYTDPLVDFILANPKVVADVLEGYGITLRDLREYC